MYSSDRTVVGDDADDDESLGQREETLKVGMMKRFEAFNFEWWFSFKFISCAL